MTTWQERNEMRLISIREKIREELLLDAIHWTHHLTVQFPAYYDDGRYLARRELKYFCRDIDREYKVRLVVSGVIVYRDKRSPHAHLVLASIPTEKTRDLSEIDPQDLLKHWRFREEARITTDRHWSQATVKNYITSEHNMNLDGLRTDQWDPFTYNHGNLEKFAGACGKYSMDGYKPMVVPPVEHMVLSSPESVPPVSV